MNVPSNIHNGVDITESLACGKDFKKLGNQTPLSLAVQSGQASIVKLLLQTEMTLDSRDSTRRTPLLQASENDHVMIMRLLIDKGANVNVSDIHEHTPLQWASIKGHEAVAKLLIEKGAVNASDKDGYM